MKSKYFTAAIIGLVILAIGCKKSDNTMLPSLTTQAVSGITVNSAVSGGSITSDGNAAISERGVCWSTSNNPTIADARTSDGSGTGDFVSNLNALSASTIYYVRAYATNSVGTAYGNEVSFTTVTPQLAELTTAQVTQITGTTAVSGGISQMTEVPTLLQEEYAGALATVRQSAVLIPLTAPERGAMPAA